MNICYTYSGGAGVKYIRNNRVFLVLLVVMIASIAYLLLQLFQSPNQNTTPENHTNGNSFTSISNFGVTLNERIELDFTWNVERGKEEIKKIEIYHNDVLFQDVSMLPFYSISLYASTIHTGNNEFTLIVTLADGKVLEKTTYYYLDEVINFKVEDERVGNIIHYYVQYTFDQTHPVKAPKVSFQLDQDSNMIIEYISSEKVKEENGFITMRAIYDLDISKATAKRYWIQLDFIFSEFNLLFTHHHLVTF